MPDLYFIIAILVYLLGLPVNCYVGGLLGAEEPFAWSFIWPLLLFVAVVCLPFFGLFVLMEWALKTGRERRNRGSNSHG